MKLTGAQNHIIQKAQKEIDFARTHTITEWATLKKFGYEVVENTILPRSWSKCGYNSLDEAMNSLTKYINTYGEHYYLAKEGIIVTKANSKTLNALEELNLIEIINDGKNKIRILNY